MLHLKQDLNATQRLEPSEQGVKKDRHLSVVLKQSNGPLYLNPAFDPSIYLGLKASITSMGMKTDSTQTHTQNTHTQNTHTHTQYTHTSLCVCVCVSDDLCYHLEILKQTCILVLVMSKG